MKTFHLPDLGEGLREAEIVAWHVGDGDRVVADQPLVSVETDKAVIEIPAPWPGTVVARHGEPGDVVQTGEPLAVFDTETGTKDAGAVVGVLPGAASDAPAADRKRIAPRSETAAVKVMPAVRRLARSLNVELDGIAGSGPGGTIISADIRAAAARDGGRKIPLRGVRRAMAQNMAKAHADVATATITDVANIRLWPDTERPMPRLVEAMVAACAASPHLNAWYDPEADLLQVHDRIDIGVAVNTEEGLFVPVLRDVGNKRREDLAAALDTAKTGVLKRTVPPSELRGQTITLSNFGTLGGRHGALVVMPPQVAIVGAGRIVKEPCAVDGAVEICPVLPISLTFDHRVITGAEAAAFLMAMIEHLERQ